MYISQSFSSCFAIVSTTSELDKVSLFFLFCFLSPNGPHYYNSRIVVDIHFSSRMTLSYRGMISKSLFADDVLQVVDVVLAQAPQSFEGLGGMRDDLTVHGYRSPTAKYWLVFESLFPPSPCRCKVIIIYNIASKVTQICLRHQRAP